MWGTQPPPPDRSGLQSVCCQVCGEEIALVAPDEIKARLASGEYATKRFVKQKAWGDGTTYSEQEGVFGVCSRCRRIAATAPVKGDSAAQADAQMNRIRDLVALIRERRTDLTLEQAVRAAITDEFDPSREPNRGFRAWLLGEGAPKDPDTDAKAREFMQWLEGVE